MNTLHILKHSKNVGDNNQSLGIAGELELLLPNHTRKVVTEEEFELSSLSNGDIVLVAGDHGLKIAADIKKSQVGSGPLVVWSGHLFFSDFEKLDHDSLWPDVVCLPKAVLTDEIIAKIPNHCRLIPTQGVPHHVNEKTLAISVAELNESPKEFVDCIGIVMAGDVPGTDGNYHCFEEDEAVEKAKEIAQDIQANYGDLANLVIILTNGPRTDAADPITKKKSDNDWHKWNSDTGPVSKAFHTELERHFPGKIRFKDFKFDENRKGLSFYLPMLHYLSVAERSRFYLPAESVSMVTESSVVAQKGVPVIVYVPQNANEDHLKVVKAAEKDGLITMLGTESLNQEIGPVTMASTQIAETVVDIVNKSVVKVQSNLVEQMSRFSSVFNSASDPSKKASSRGQLQEDQGERKPFGPNF